jgi:hypothetical protein
MHPQACACMMPAGGVDLLPAALRHLYLDPKSPVYDMINKENEEFDLVKMCNAVNVSMYVCVYVYVYVCVCVCT